MKSKRVKETFNRDLQSCMVISVWPLVYGLEFGVTVRAISVSRCSLHSADELPVVIYLRE